jgi:D-glycero-alpha-D-manno-heptose-7-phosphate kinase
MNGSVDPLRQGESLVEVTRDVESTVIKVPAGLQDYYGAMFGGLQSLKWGAGFHERKTHSLALLPELGERLVLFYSGQSRNSGINNWALFKSFIDKNPKTQEQFLKINQAALTLEQALEHHNFAWVGESIENEWATRKTLAEGITTPEIDQAFQKAKTLGIKAGKICGAGGGGCFFLYLPELNSALKLKLIEEITQVPSVRHLPFNPVAQGLVVQHFQSS